MTLAQTLADSRFAVRQLDGVLSSVLCALALASTPVAAHAQYVAPAQAEPVATTEAQQPTPTAAPLPPAAVPASDPPWTFRLGEVLFHPQLQVRTRAEDRQHPYASAAPLDSELHFVTTRFRVGLTIDYRAWRVMFQAQDARNFGLAPLGSDPGSSFGVHQAYGEYRTGGSFVRVGRQEVAYGDERLVGPLDWASGARAFDGIRGHAQLGKVGLDAMGAMIAPQATYTYPGPVPAPTATSAGDFFGAGQLSVAASEGMHLELLYLYRRDRADANSATRNRRINAGSVRVFGSPARGLRYAAEGVFEWGEVNDARFIAYAAAADIFYSTQAANVTTVSAGGALASGERAGRVGEFENFFPTNHKFYGFSDLVGWRNLIEGHVTVNQRLASHPLTLAVSGHAFFLERTDARWTNAVGGLVAAAVPGSGRFLGAELDVSGSYRFGELVSLTGGYSIFAPASAASRLGQDRTNHWLWMMIDFRTP